MSESATAVLPAPAGAGPAGADWDRLNRVALGTCRDTRHHIRFRGDGGAVTALTLAELDRRAAAVAGHLRTLGVRTGDRVGVMARNRIEWVLVDLAVLKLGAVTAGFEHGRFQPDRIVAEYGLRLLFTEFADGVRGGAAVHDIAAVAGWADGPAPDGPLHAGYDPADVCAIKFTSGSTGVPKGLEVSVASVNDSLAGVQEMFDHRDGDNILVFLRLALLQQRYWIYSALANGHDVTVADLADAVALARDTAPTVVMGVPGFYAELKVALEAGGPVDDPAARGAAIQAALGGRVRYLWTGSAPCSPAVLRFFNDAGVPLYEGYGLNETCIVAKNHPGAYRIGSVGQVLPHKTVRFDRDGVLIVGSRNPVNTRYTWCAPGTNERTFLLTGEVKTYDVGHVDDDGFLYIHGRVDDILTLSSGRNVLVRLVEEKLREHPGVHDCVLYGAGRAYLCAVVSPAAPDVDRAALAAHVAEVNAGLLPEQRVHALYLAPQRFSLDNGLLTSQYKPRRGEIHRRYADGLAALYDGDPPVTPDGSAVRVVAAESVPHPQETEK